MLLSAPVAFVGLWPRTGPALVCLGVVGIGNVLAGVAALTLVQRSVPNPVLARAFGAPETVTSSARGLGALVAPALVAALGIRAALVVTGAFLPLLLLGVGRRLLTLDAEAVTPLTQLRLLQGLPMFAPLPAPVLEALASSMSVLRYPTGATVLRQGELGDSVYVIAEGEVEVTRDGRDVVFRRAGDYFGEIAHLRGVPRTATITARTDVELYAPEGEAFLAAVSGHPASERAADAAVASRLAALRAMAQPAA